MAWGLSRCCDLLSRLLFVIACAQICFLSFRKWDATEAFCWHPPLMTAAVLLLYQEGVRTVLRPNYRAHFLRLGREWSQYLQVPLSAQDAFVRQRQYGAMLVATLVALLAGAACAAWSKHAVGLSPAWPLTTHSMFGAVALVLLALHGAMVWCGLCRRRTTYDPESKRHVVHYPWAAAPLGGAGVRKGHSGAQRHRTNCANFLGAAVCMLLLLAMTLGVVEVHSSSSSTWSRVEVECFAGLIAAAVFLEVVVWVWRPALQTEQREISKAEFPVFSKMRTTETEAW